jgi:hypothetical protein
VSIYGPFSVTATSALSARLFLDTAISLADQKAQTMSPILLALFPQLRIIADLSPLPNAGTGRFPLSDNSSGAIASLPFQTRSSPDLAYLTPRESELKSIRPAIGQSTGDGYTKTRAFPFTAAFHEKEGLHLLAGLPLAPLKVSSFHGVNILSRYRVSVSLVPSRFLRSPYGARSMMIKKSALIFNLQTLEKLN